MCFYEQQPPKKEKMTPPIFGKRSVILEKSVMKENCHLPPSPPPGPELLSDLSSFAVFPNSLGPVSKFPHLWNGDV